MRAPPPLRAVTPISSNPDATPRPARGARRPDFAARLKSRIRPLRARVQRRDALIETIREANASLDPRRVAEWLVQEANSWIPVAVLGGRGVRQQQPAQRAGGRRAYARPQPLALVGGQLGDAARRRAVLGRSRPATRAAAPGASARRWPFRWCAATGPLACWWPSTRRRRRRRRRWGRRCCWPCACSLKPSAIALDNALAAAEGRSAVGHRRPDPSLQLALSEPGAAPRNEARLAKWPSAVAAVPRPRRLQAGQR